MATIYVYNSSSGAVEKYNRGLDEPMPYNIGRTMTVREFRARSCSSILWTTKAAMDAWNNLRQSYGAPIYIGAVFKRIWEGGHSGQSQHYAGVAFDVGQTMTQAQRDRIHRIATQSGMWGYVEPLSMTPTWVHADRRFGTPACASGGYPLLRRGSKGVYVFILQDALATLGFPGGGLDGVFGAGLQAAVKDFQAQHNLSEDGVVGCGTWRAITTNVVGTGQTATTIGKC